MVMARDPIVTNGVSAMGPPASPGGEHRRWSEASLPNSGLEHLFNIASIIHHNAVTPGPLLLVQDLRPDLVEPGPHPRWLSFTLRADCEDRVEAIQKCEEPTASRGS